MELSSLHSCSSADLPVVSSEEKNYTVNKSENKTTISLRSRGVKYNMHCHTMNTYEYQAAMERLKTCEQPFSVWSSFSKKELLQTTNAADALRKTEENSALSQNLHSDPDFIHFCRPGCQPCQLKAIKKQNKHRVCLIVEEKIWNPFSYSIYHVVFN